MVVRDLASSSHVMMLSSTKHRDEIMVNMRNKDYGNPNTLIGKATDQLASSTLTSFNPSPNVIPIELTFKQPKGIIHKFEFNPCARAAQNYNIVEDLAQVPYAMSTLDVLHNCPSQKR